ncbi:MFS transporter [Streptomyces sp. NPDC052109]|uniref:MFS transporter n=1 Tax=Streptomyces sp. NPDC052109 TaxID=3155527 RepID=UPI00342A7AD4
MNRRWVLAGSVAGAVAVALDGTVLTVTQPRLQGEFDASLAEVQWTSTAYLVVVASLLVFAGRLGDRYGQRRVFALGMLGFGAASAAIGVAPGVGWVIGLRALQGVFGALLQPATLGMLRAAYPPDRLAGPLAVRTAAIGLAAAAGPLVGGALVTTLGWRAVFFVNVLPALVFGLPALPSAPPEPPRYVVARARRRRGWSRPRGGGRSAPAAHPAGAPADRDALHRPCPRPRRTPAASRTPLDVPGALLLAVTLSCLVHSVTVRPVSGAGLAVAAVAAAVLVRHERRTPSPLLSPAVVGSRAVGAALGVLVVVSAALFGALFVATYVLQRRLGLDPLHSALRSLPLAVTMVASAALCPVLLRRLGARGTATAATSLLALGVLMLSGASAAPALGCAFALLGAGFGTVMVAATQVVVRRAEVAVAGVAGGLQQTALNVGPAVGVAAASTLMAAGTGAALLVLAAVAALAVPLARALPAADGEDPRPGAEGERAVSRAFREQTAPGADGVASITHTADERVDGGAPAGR